MQAYRFALEPTRAQERALCSHAGASRFAWNWGLTKCKERYEAERKWYTAFDLGKLWRAETKINPELSWCSENSSTVYQWAFLDLGRALGDFVKSKNGQRKGKRLGFPKFKKRGKSKDSFRVAGRNIGCAGKAVTLPRLGTIKTHESTRKLARRLADGSARILSANVTRAAQRWFVSFTVEVERNVPEHGARPGSAAGIDLGVKTLLTGIDDQGQLLTVDGPKPLRAALRKLRKMCRAHSRKRHGSANRRKSTSRLARVHARVANVRADALHKATTAIARDYETVIVENLNVEGLLKNRSIARAVSDQGFGNARRMLGYKTTWNGGTLILADRFYPSSKLCSSCGWRKPSLTLKERVFACEACGHTEDRDVNAARNLLHLAASGAESRNACGGTVRPRPARQDPLKQEPGASHEGQTGTAAPQGTAAA